MTLVLYNTRTRAKQEFIPLDPANIRAYLCGPTVYDRAHIGNARNVVVFDILIRLLRRLYPRVTYVRNITDIDDKINARAKERGQPIEVVTAGPIAAYHEDMGALFALPPDVEPRATDHLPDIIDIIRRLLAGGHAYEAEGHVLFAVSSDPQYGKFSGHSQEDLLAGARVDVAPYKRDPGDFVLWKPSTDDLPGWESPWGRGRPGWHIECSAMSHKHLGADFDIHGGGADLIFPHHENEIAQSCCAFPGSKFANIWVHNRMLNVNGEKMSKSLGNQLVLHDVLGKAPGEAVRFLLIRAHYRAVLDFSDTGLVEARRELDRFYRAIDAHDVRPSNAVPDCVLLPLLDDLNTPGAIAGLHQLADAALAGDATAAAGLRAAGQVMGLFNVSPQEWFHGGADGSRIEALVQERWAARAAKNYQRADEIRKQLEAEGILLEDGPRRNQLAPGVTGRDGGADLTPIEPSPVVILVRPQMAENIGATARAMGNGGLFHLRLVAPRDGWPQERAWRMASGAHRILDGAQVFATVGEAVADLHRVFATCPRPRHIIKPVLTARGGAAELVATGRRGLRAGVLFGPERAGLDNDDIACTDSLIRYDLNPDFMSLNLAQAVMILGYEWWLARTPDLPARELQTNETAVATKGELDNFMVHLIRECDESGFLKNEQKRPGMVRNLRHFFTRGEVTKQELQTLHGVVSELVRGRKK